MYLFLTAISASIPVRSVFKCLFSSKCVDFEGSRLCSAPFVSLRIFSSVLF